MRSSALWWVVNGRAAAPPYSGCSTGVSTSMKPSRSRNCLTAEITRARRMNSSRASSLAIRSSSRWRKRVSTSCRPWCFSGGGRSDLASRVKSVMRRVSSPRRERKATPSTPTRSPISRLRSRSRPASPSSSTRAWSWIRPERSTRSRKAIRPCSRRAANRPATRCEMSVSCPGASASCAARTSETGSTSANACGNGSTPAARNASSLRRRAASSSLGASGSPSGRRGPPTSRRRSW